MKFDTIIIGGGLSGLIAGIELARGQNGRVAIVSTGQSSLHFNSGSLELLGYDREGNPVESPFEAIDSLEADHPYRRIGSGQVEEYSSRIKPLLGEAGIATYGETARNHWRISPMGIFKPVWLTMEGCLTVQAPDSLPWKHVTIVNISGFQDFHPRFLAAALRSRGVRCDIATVSVKALAPLRKSVSEMRSANIARVLQGEAVDELAGAINNITGKDTGTIIMPAVTGFSDDKASDRLRSMLRKPVLFAGVMGASVPGIRMQAMLQRRFRRLGGTIFNGDSVKDGDFDRSRLTAVRTVNLGDEPLQGRNFIFCAGSFFNHGLRATPGAISEPVLGLDVDAPADGNMEKWFDKDIFKPQPYMKFGVAVSDRLHAMRDNAELDNVWVAGASLPGADAIREGSGGGIAAITALHAAHAILNGHKS